MFENSIWKNPIGWAEKVIGIKRNYAMFLAIHVFAGVMTIIYCKPVPVAISLTVIITFLPIGYLRALKALLSESRNKK